jgi:superfamily II DNA/RNA helicase
LYVGIFAPGYGSFQSIQVRVASALLQAGEHLAPSLRDAYWTNLWFFNSIRELGNTLSLLQFDVRRMLLQIRQRDKLANSRKIFRHLELTSRLQSHQVPAAIGTLEVAYSERNNRALDVCLASNIIEVGIDIERLGLLVIAGQPKSTAQYIQVSGRVGRKTREAPGIVVSIYSPTKPRDRSHYEKFRSYHERMFQFVEPSSVTPFSFPVLKRALHAVLVAGVRMNSSSSQSPYPFEDVGVKIQQTVEVLTSARPHLTNDEVRVLNYWIQRRVKEWSDWKKANWSAWASHGDPRNALMREADTIIGENDPSNFWRTPNSLRTVDAESELRIVDFWSISNPKPNEMGGEL